nr:hypothetical protein [Candidatus Freyarchaeota archaeon]
MAGSVQPALVASDLPPVYRYSFFNACQEASALTVNGKPHRRRPPWIVARLASLSLWQVYAAGFAATYLSPTLGASSSHRRRDIGKSPVGSRRVLCRDLSLLK